MIKTNSLNFSYGKKQILFDVTLNIKKGEVVSLVGSNGSGKSTLLQCLNGNNKIFENKISICNKPIQKYKRNELAKKIAFLPQFQEKMPGYSVKEIVAMGRTPFQKTGWIVSTKDKDITNWAMEYMKIYSLKNKCIESLSGGEKQRVWIAMILAQDTPIIFLDEPVTYMDMENQYELLNIIEKLKNEQNKTIISVFHDINHALDVSDKICILKNGKIFDYGSPEKTITENNLLKSFNIKTKIINLETSNKSFVIPIKNIL